MAFFHNLSSIYGKTDRIFIKVLSQICLVSFDEKVPIKFGSHLNRGSVCGLQIRTGFAVADVCARLPALLFLSNNIVLDILKRRVDLVSFNHLPQD